jgi:hypothetical protein
MRVSLFVLAYTDEGKVLAPDTTLFSDIPCEKCRINVSKLLLKIGRYNHFLNQLECSEEAQHTEPACRTVIRQGLALYVIALFWAACAAPYE